MVKIFQNRWVFELPWASVTNAWIQKYPNAHSLQVDQVDTIQRKYDKKTGSFIIRRLISASLRPPLWMEAIGFPSEAYILEEAIIDPIKKEMTLRSINITGNQLLEIEEICTYKQHKSDAKEHTLYKQKAIIESSVPILHSPIETYALGIHAGHADKGLTAMKQICDQFDTVGPTGLEQILQWRLDTILLLHELKSLQNTDLKDMNLSLAIWNKK